MRVMKRLSKRTLSVILSMVIFLTMFAGALSFLAVLTVSAAVDGRNRSVPVQLINLLPSKDDKNDFGNFENKSPDDVTVGDSDETLELYAATGNAGTVTLTVNQKINLVLNPWLYLQWSAIDATTDAKISFKLMNSFDRGRTIKTSEEYTVTLSEIAAYADKSYSEGEAPSPFSGSAERYVNFFNYICERYGWKEAIKNSSIAGAYQYYPLWAAQQGEQPDENGLHTSGVRAVVNDPANCMEITKITYTVTPSKAGASVSWGKCAVGREVASRPASVLPDNRGKIFLVSGGTPYTAVDQGKVYLRNPDDAPLTFQWDTHIYFNASELRSLLMTVDEYTGLESGGSSAADFSAFDIRLKTGGQITSFNNTKYSVNDYWGTGDKGWISIRDDLGASFSSYNIPFYDFIKDKASFPQDSLLYIETVQVTVPAQTTLCLSQLEFQVTDEFVASAEADKAYPWSAAEGVEGLPVEGSPAVSQSIQEGYPGVVYDWATALSAAPTVARKIDLLSMDPMYDEEAVAYARTVNGDATLKASDTAPSASQYVSLRRRQSQTTSTFPLSLSTTPYLYYSFSTSGDASVGFFFATTGGSYYIEQTGLTMKAAPSNDAIMRGLLKTGAAARTGCIDLKQVFGADATVTVQEVRIYVWNGGEVHVDYFYVGSESLKEADSSIFAKAEGDAFSWSVEKATFDNATNGQTGEFTFANKVDLLDDTVVRCGSDYVFNGVQYSSEWGLSDQLNGQSVREIPVTGKIASGLDTPWSIDTGVLKYMYYSVDAPAGVRWSIGFIDTQGIVVARSFLADAQDASRSECLSIFGDVWDQHAGANLMSGSETGCLNIAEATDQLKTNKIAWIVLFCEKGAGVTDEEYSAWVNAGNGVRFHYAYLTSEPIENGTVGKAARENGTVYNWKATEGITDLDEQIDLLTVAGMGAAFTAGYQESSSFALTIDLEQTPYLFYSFASAPSTSSRVGSGTFSLVLDSSNYYIFRDASQSLTSPAFSKNTMTSGRLQKQKYVRDAETGCVDLRDILGQNTGRITIKQLKVFLDTATTEWFGFDYLYIGRVGTLTKLVEEAPIYDSGDNFQYLTSPANANSSTKGAWSLTGSAQGSVVFWWNGSKAVVPAQTYANDDTHDPPRYSAGQNVNNTASLNAVDKGCNLTAAWWSLYNDFSKITETDYRYLYLYGSTDDGESNWSFWIEFDDNTALTVSPNNATALTEVQKNEGGLFLDPADNQFLSGKAKLYGFDLLQYKEAGRRMKAVRIFRKNINTALHVSILLGKKAPTAISNPLRVSSGSNPSIVSASPVSGSAAAYDPAKDTEKIEFSGNTADAVDLTRTPYLYYSLAGADGGTFSLQTTVAGNVCTLYRDSGANSGLISENSSTRLFGDETGCIDLYSYFKNKGYTDEQLRSLIFTRAWTRGASPTYTYMYFGTKVAQDIDLIPEKANGDITNGVSSLAWSFQWMDGTPGHSAYSLLDDEKGVDGWNVQAYTQEAAYPDDLTLQVSYEGGASESSSNRLSYADTRTVFDDNRNVGYHAILYGGFTGNGNTGAGSGNQYCPRSTENVGGFYVDLERTPYLHFSLEQEEDSLTVFVLQTVKKEENFESGYDTISVNGGMTNAQIAAFDAENSKYSWAWSAQNAKPYLSAYASRSKAGQLMKATDSSYSYLMTYYKDTTINELFANGNMAGVIDLKTWYMKTNGYTSPLIELAGIRFYSVSKDGLITDAKVNHFYLSATSGAAYTVNFVNDSDFGIKGTYSQAVLENANEQYVTDEAARKALQMDTVEDAVFTGWYTDKELTEYFDIETAPIIRDTTLYAGWIDKSAIEQGGAVDILACASVGVSPDKVVTVDEDTLTINNTTDTAYSYSWDVNKAYSLDDWHSWFIGLDTDTTIANGSERPVVSLNITSCGAFDYSTEDFSRAFGGEEGDMTAAPYDEELPLYASIVSKEHLPSPGNTDNLVLINSATVTVPAGVSVSLRYCKIACSTEMLEPKKTTTSLPTDFEADLLAKNGQFRAPEIQQYVGYSEAGYSEVTDTSPSATVQRLYSASLTGVERSYVSMGGLFGLEDATSYALEKEGKHLHLYYSITQPETSYTTFALYTGVITGYEDYWLSFYDGVNKTLLDQSRLEKGSIPLSCYIAGSETGSLDLYDWYSVTGVQEISLSAWRLYTAELGTNALFSYFFLGYEDPAASSEPIEVAVVYDGGSYPIGSYQIGESVTASLDLLRQNGISEAFDAKRRFVGWQFNGQTVYWNKDATNDVMWSLDNPNGAWSLQQEDGFVQNLAEVTYQLTSETTVITPVWETVGNPKLTVTGGTATGSMASDGGAYTYEYGTYATVTATDSSFAGWYDQNGRLLSETKDLVVCMTEDTVLTTQKPQGAKTDTLPEGLNSGKFSVWLRHDAEQEVSLTTISTDAALTPKESDGVSCYWRLDASELVCAVAPDGYHWEQVLSNGEQVPFGSGREVTFIVGVNTDLVCVPDNGTAPLSSPMSSLTLNDHAVDVYTDEQRTKSTLSYTARCDLAEGERMISCGMAVIDLKERAALPFVGSADTVCITASAWNAATGQFAVSIPLETTDVFKDGSQEPAYRYHQRYAVRAYAVICTADGDYKTVYSAVRSMSA